MSIPVKEVLVGQLICFALILVLALLPDRITGRSALYRLALFLSNTICAIAAVLPALATVIEQLPARISEEWRRERACDSFEEQERRPRIVGGGAVS